MENKEDLFYNNLRMKYKMQINSQPQKDLLFATLPNNDNFLT